MHKHRFLNMYLTTTISVALVLTLIGVEVVMLLSAHNLLKSVKENVCLTLVLNQTPDSVEVGRINSLLTVAPFVKEYRFISEQEALTEHILNLGEDPTDFVGYNPLRASFEIYLNADYACADSIEVIEGKLSQFQSIEKTLYPKDVVSVLDQNVERVSIIILAVALILLFVAVALIVNTIRLHIYSKRFLINTMKLVGAKSWTIKRPFVWRSVRIGVVAALLALLILAAMWLYCQRQLGIVILIPTWQNIVIVSAVVFLCAVCITSVAASFATGKYIRMRTNDLYYI